MSEFDDLMADLRRLRDEIRVRVHLASMEVREDWRALDGRWENFKARAEVSESKEGIGEAALDLGRELKKGFQRVHRALKD